MNYKLYKTFSSQIVNAVMMVDSDSSKSFLFDPANTDYQAFKKDLAAGVQLEDATGTVMTADQIATFVATLP